MSILSAVALITILVFIHEFGHFIVAKACGVHVTVFSFGFGKRLIGMEIGGTDYRVSMLPFGGYVKMAGADPFGMGEEDDDILDDPSRAFLRKPVWQRLLVVAAGPAFNLALPLVVFTILLMAGEPQPAAVVGGIQRESVLLELGMKPGDQISEVDGVPVQTWGQMARAVEAWEPGAHWLTLESLGQQRQVEVDWRDGGEATALGLSFLRPSTIAGVDDPLSPAGVAGIETGDQILRVAGEPVDDWVEMATALSRSETAVEIVLSREGVEQTVGLQRASDTWRLRSNGGRRDAAESWGLVPATIFVGSVGPTVDKDTTDFFAGCRPEVSRPPAPAYQAGLTAGDRFFRLDGQAVESWGDVLNGVGGTMDGDGATATARPIQVELIRAGELIQLSLTPTVIKDTNAMGRYYHRPVLGVVRMGGFVDGPTTRVYHNFSDAVGRAATETWMITGYIVEQIGKLVTGGAAIQRSLGGPVEMVRQASQAAEKGLFAWARLMGMLSISLGIINLLPVPVLDGGQFLFYAIEGLRGRPLSLAIREKAQQIGVLFLVMLMLSVLVFDLRRLFE
jgi:regulator of sigma E protease